MPLVPVKCTSCGALQEADSDNAQEKCKSCGASFAVKEAFLLFNKSYSSQTPAASPARKPAPERFEDRDFYVRGSVLIKYAGPGGDVVIPEQVRVIGEMAFAHSPVSSVLIPESVSKIGWRAFYMCHKLRDVTIPGSVKDLEAAFYCCFSLKTVRISEGVERIGENAFQGCRALTSVFIPKSVKTISCYVCDDNGQTVTNSAFNECPRISDLHFAGERFEQPFIGTRWWRESTEEGVRAVQEEQLRKKREQWKRDGKCLYCGGDLKGIFNIKCMQCGKKSLNRGPQLPAETDI